MSKRVTINEGLFRIALTKKGWSQRKLSMVSGISQSTITKSFNTGCLPNTIWKISKALEVDVMDLIERSEE